MRRSNRLRAIYFELRHAAGTEVSAGDLLRLAHFILKSYGVDKDELADFGKPRDSRAFYALPVDEAMRDGGWQVLDFEEHRAFGIDDLEPPELALLKFSIQRFLGPQWQMQIPPD
jgi:hypothetical protein